MAVNPIPIREEGLWTPGFTSAAIDTAHFAHVTIVYYLNGLVGTDISFVTEGWDPVAAEWFTIHTWGPHIPPTNGFRSFITISPDNHYPLDTALRIVPPPLLRVRVTGTYTSATYAISLHEVS